MIVYEENLDYSKYLEFALGECAQALDEPNVKNNNKSRTLDKNKVGITVCKQNYYLKENLEYSSHKKCHKLKLLQSVRICQKALRLKLNVE